MIEGVLGAAGIPIQMIAPPVWKRVAGIAPGKENKDSARAGRMGRTLEEALAELREFDAAHPRAGAPESTQQARRFLVTEAGHALWMFVVQREACGLRDSRTVMRDYDVPGEVQQCMGVVLATSTRDAI